MVRNLYTFHIVSYRGHKHIEIYRKCYKISADVYSYVFYAYHVLKMWAKVLRTRHIDGTGVLIEITISAWHDFVLGQRNA